MYDGGHGADQLPESLDCLGFADPGTATPLMLPSR
jgi:hypothetical protein